jgi:hypothetical protein
MRRLVLALAAVGLCGPAVAAPLTTADCSRIAAQVGGDDAALELDLTRLIRDGDSEVAAAARRFEVLRSGLPQGRAALVNALHDLRYQLQICARR